jgi:hypothetical protein
MGEKRNAYRLLVGKKEGKRPLGGRRRRWMDIKMNPREIGWDGIPAARLRRSVRHWGVLLTLILGEEEYFFVLVRRSGEKCRNVSV